MNQAVAKPLPNISDFNRPFWEGARARTPCATLRQLRQGLGAAAPSARGACPTNFIWTRSRTAARLLLVVFHKLYHPGFAKDLPYNVALVELDEGPRVIANIVGIDNRNMRHRDTGRGDLRGHQRGDQHSAFPQDRLVRGSARAVRTAAIRAARRSRESGQAVSGNPPPRRGRAPIC